MRDQFPGPPVVQCPKPEGGSEIMSSITQKSSFGVAQIILFFSIAILVIVVAFPVLLILFNAFWVKGEFNIGDVAKIILEPDTYQALTNSLIIASGTTIGSTIVGTFFAWLVTRTDLPYKNFMKAMFLVPFMLPSFIGALAWKMLLSPNAGFINKFFMNTMGFDGPIFNIYSYLGIVLVEVMYLFPFVFIQVCGALETHGPDPGGVSPHIRGRAFHHHQKNHHSVGAAKYSFRERC